MSALGILNAVQSLLKDDAAIKREFDGDTLTIKMLRMAVALKLDISVEQVGKKETKAALLQCIDDAEPSDDESVPAKPTRKSGGGGEGGSGKITDKAAFEERLKDDGWVIESKARAGKEAGEKVHVDKYYTHPSNGESLKQCLDAQETTPFIGKKYRSLVSIARECFPDSIAGGGEPAAPRAKAAPKAKALPKPKAKAKPVDSDDDEPKPKPERKLPPAPEDRKKAVKAEEVVVVKAAATVGAVRAMETALDTCAKAKDWSSVLRLLKELALQTVGMDALQGTTIGRTVAQLKKCESDVVKRHAKALVAKWKLVVSGDKASDKRPRDEDYQKDGDEKVPKKAKADPDAPADAAPADAAAPAADVPMADAAPAADEPLADAAADAPAADAAVDAPAADADAEPAADAAVADASPDAAVDAPTDAAADAPADAAADAPAAAVDAPAAKADAPADAADAPADAADAPADAMETEAPEKEIPPATDAAAVDA